MLNSNALGNSRIHLQQYFLNCSHHVGFYCQEQQFFLVGYLDGEPQSVKHTRICLVYSLNAWIYITTAYNCELRVKFWRIYFWFTDKISNIFFVSQCSWSSNISVKRLNWIHYMQQSLALCFLELPSSW